MDEEQGQKMRSYAPTLERPPIVDFYRNSIDVVRPTMGQLVHGNKAETKALNDISIEKQNNSSMSRDKGDLKSNLKSSPPKEQKKRVKFNWVEGVLVRCILNIFGVILYIRMGWVAGQAGIILGCVVVLVAALITTITAISMCAICTNGVVKGGGAYFLISRNLGPEFGGSIGLIYSLTNAIAVALYIVGFGETMRDLLKQHNVHFIDGGLWEVRIVGFAVYFPAATGIMGGANISGDLADPQRAIPLGTLVAIGFCTFVYVATIWMTGSTCVRDADGIFPPVVNGTRLIPPCATDQTCAYGLMNYYQITELESFFGPLITAGIFASALSSGLASLVSSSKVFKAVCQDHLFPRIDFFGKGYGKNEEPRRAYVLGFVIAIAATAVGSLNAIAPIISNFFLITYALINYACFDASFADSPGFRPGFKYYNMWVALAGALLCIAMMFIMNWIAALITFFCFALLFLYILYSKPDVNWGSSTQARTYKNALAAMFKLSHTEEHVKNYRPQLLVLCGNVVARPSLIDFAYNITKGHALMICGYVVPHDPSERVYSVMRKLDQQFGRWLRKRHIRAFYISVADANIRGGTQSLLQVCGLGHLKPNVILLGFKSNWCQHGTALEALLGISDYFDTIQDAFNMNMAVCVFRDGNLGFDFTEAMKRLNVGDVELLQANLEESEGKKEYVRSNGTYDEDKYKGVEEKANVLTPKALPDSCDPVSLEADLEEEGLKNMESEKLPHVSDIAKENRSTPTAEQAALLASMTRFRKKVKKGVIDVWWLYDDGGLTLLLPHLLRISKSYLEGAKLRVFTLPAYTYTVEEEQHSMAALLSKFRIDFADVSVIPDISREPQLKTLSEWEKVIYPFIASDDAKCLPGMTTRSELDAQKQKTYRQLRAAELLREHSTNADLIVMTLPVPRKGMVSASLYLSWLEMMTREVPPTLLVRGNQTSVLTFYS